MVFEPYGFSTLVLNWVCFLRRSYFFIIINKNINKSPLQIMFGINATVPAATVKNRLN